MALDEAALALRPKSAAAQDVQPAHDRRQEVVEVVRDAAGKLTHRLELLRLTERLLGPLAVGDVERFHDECQRIALRTTHRPHAHVE